MVSQEYVYIPLGNPWVYIPLGIVLTYISGYIFLVQGTVIGSFVSNSKYLGDKKNLMLGLQCLYLPS